MATNFLLPVVDLGFELVKKVAKSLHIVAVITILFNTSGAYSYYYTRN